MERKEQEVAEEYLSSLADLNLNSKPLINMLTILAEENIEYAPIIVKSVEQHIAKVGPDVKLPVLYLIDSIVKNVGREYIQLFSHCIVNIFCGVFEKVNEKIREKMYTLRQTWNDVFTPQKLYTLDVKVNCMDPNWPITAKVVPKSPAIHVNPNFLKNKSEPLNEMQAKLRDKQRQLLELQKRKLELELAATKQRLEEQEKQLSMQTESVKAMATPAGISSINPPIRPMFNPYKGTPQRHPNMMSLQPGFSSANPSLTKVRVAPVNPNMIAPLRHRDPRLARQQQQALQQLQGAETAPSAASVSSKTPGTSGNEDASNIISSQESKASESSSEKSASKSENSKTPFGSKDKTKSSSVGHSDNKRLPKGNYEKNVDKSPIRATSNSRNSKGSRGVKNSSTIFKSYDKDCRGKEKSTTPSEKKKNNKADSPTRFTEKSSNRQNEKSPKRATESSKSSASSTSSGTKFKDIKQGIKSRNYIRRNRERSESPPPIKDVDLRPLTGGSQEKRVKLADKTTPPVIKNEQGSPKSPESQVIAKESKLPDLEKNVEPLSCKDVDLRQFQANTPKVENNIGTITTPQYPERSSSPSKRPSTDNSEEPAAKKSKRDKIDVLFGTEDVDLRTMNANPILPSSAITINSAKPMTPPPPPIISNESENWAKVKGSKENKGVLSAKSKLDDVRAKLAKATKGHLTKCDKEKEARKQSRFNDLYEDSQDGTDANIRTIISQAQELLDSENMNVDQYNTLVKTVIQINETNKLKEAQRRESLLNRPTADQEIPAANNEVTKMKSETEDDKAIAEREKSKSFVKRIPRIPKEEHGEQLVEQSASLHRLSPTNTNSSAYQEIRPNNNPKPEKRLRTRESKWSSPWDTVHNVGVNSKPWVPGSNHRPPFNSKLTQPPLTNNRPPMPSPWQNPPPMIFAAPIPSIQLPQLSSSCTEQNPALPASSQFSNSVDNPKSDVVRTINIDSVAKEIRIYDEVAIVFMDWDQPREIGFQNGQRRIIVDDQEPITLSFNDDYKTIVIDGKPHKIRFGCPSREIYIDENWYECCFGGPPLAIPLEGKVHIIKIEGPPPQVNIGNLRQDLVAGKINLIVDARIIIPVFLDAKLQTFELDGKKHTLQFADTLKTVLIDNEPIQVEYGGLPKSLFLGGIKYFVRFGTLPNGIIPGKIFIRNMICTDFVKASDSLSSISSNEDFIQQASPQEPSSQDQQNRNNGESSPDESKPPLVEQAPSSNSTILPSVNTFNIDELFQKLLASGILNQNANGNNAADNSNKSKNSDLITPINLSKPETIKARQAGIVQKLFCGMQCSSCGVRFPPEQTMKYSQHLDWHFRQNRRERDSSRKAHSRKWYYDVSDWIQYEEIEDLDDREKNWFEAQQSELDNLDEGSNQKALSPLPSCPAGPNDVDKACDMCHDKFEQFYNEEFEEWHLRSAIRVEDKIYHPLCYQDYKSSLSLENTSPKTSEVTGENNEIEPVVVIKEEKCEKDKECETILEDEDDDVIVVPIEEPSITEIPDDDEEEVKVVEENTSDSAKISEDTQETKNKSNNITTTEKNESIESDVEIQEPNIPFTDLDTYEEVHPQSISTLDESSQSSQFNNIRIKEEPKDDSDDDAFEDVGTFLTADDISQSMDEYIPQVINNPGGSHDILASIDGNVEIQDTPTTVGVNKIKINITKNTAPTQKSNPNVCESVSTIPVICNVQESGSRIESSSPEIVQSESNTSTIEFTYKPELRNIDFKIMPTKESGYETSGLCSIM